LNYLGHLFLSGDDKWIMLGNLLVDFAKGNRFDRFDTRIHEGIKLHRRIDHYMDNHEIVLELSKQVSAELPKVAPIAIDIVFDHLLAKHWETYHAQPLETFLDEFFDFHLNRNDVLLPDQPRELLFRLNERRMIHHYTNPLTIDRIANHLESRLSFDTQLPRCRAVYEAYPKVFETSFHLFMEEVVNIFPSLN
jgi:acyl carrier protein phosphodiesterase